jgi:very-short-patch-repair endonuclease
VNGFYLDFACEDLKLAIELDGGQHNDPVHGAHDTRRAAALHKSGWRILRFWNNEVMENIEGVLAVIAQALTQNPRCGF